MRFSQDFVQCATGFVNMLNVKKRKKNVVLGKNNKYGITCCDLDDIIIGRDEKIVRS